MSLQQLVFKKRKQKKKNVVQTSPLIRPFHSPLLCLAKEENWKKHFLSEREEEGRGGKGDKQGEMLLSGYTYYS